MPELETFPYLDRDTLLNKVFETAHEFITTEREEIAPAIFLANPATQHVDYTFVMEFLQNSATKNLLTKLVSRTVQHNDIVATVLVTEGWAASFSREEYDKVLEVNPNFRPSDDPNRQEVLMLVAEDATGMTTKTYAIAADRSELTLLYEQSLTFPEHVTEEWLSDNLPTRFVFFPQHMSRERQEDARRFNPTEMENLAEELLQHMRDHHDEGDTLYVAQLSSMDADTSHDKRTLKA